jgi:hypothetical protein
MKLHRLPIPVALSLLLGVATGCSSFRTRDNFQPQRMPKLAGVPTATELFQQASTQWWDAASKGEKTGATAPQKQAFLTAGLNLSDELADAWLKGQFRQDTDSRYWKNAFNTTLSLTTAALGWTAAAPKLVTAVGATGVAINSGWNNYEAAYLLSSAMPKVIDKLKSFRKTLRNQIEEDFRAKSYSYVETRTLIDRYHDTISRESVKNFIDSSIDLAQASYKNPAAEVLSAPETVALNKALYGVIYGPEVQGSFTQTELVVLFVYNIDGANSAVVKALKEKPAYLSLLAKADGLLGANKTEFSRLLSKLDSLAALAPKADALKREFLPAKPDSIDNGLKPQGGTGVSFQPKIESIK